MAKKRRPKSKNYFTKDTEAAIVRYNNTDDPAVRSKIYEEEIHYAFFKLTQNIIHTFKFYYTEVSDIEHLQHEIITYLLDRIHLFDPSKGSKAYSYFGTVVKNYLIITNTRNYKKRVDKADISEIEQDEKYSYDVEGEEVERDDLSDFMDLWLEYCNENLFTLFPKKGDAEVADAVLEIFRRRQDLDVFNKKALYIYIREMVDVKTPKITKIANQLYNTFRENYIFYLNHGYVTFD